MHADDRLQENRDVLAGLAAKGVPTDRLVEINFICSFKTVDEARAFRKMVRDYFVEKGLPKQMNETLYGICDYSRQGDPSEMHLSTKMRPSVETITEVEAVLAMLSEGTNNLEIGWEFADPRNDQIKAPVNG